MVKKYKYKGITFKKSNNMYISESVKGGVIFAFTIKQMKANINERLKYYG